MNCHFRKIVDERRMDTESKIAAPADKRAFTLIEIVVSLAVLALICSSVLVVFERSLKAAADSNQKMQAFEIARENMEKLLATDTVSEMAEYGTSVKYPDITWQTTVESFYEPITNRMWLRGVCSAEYTDSSDSRDTVQLTHWLTNLTKEQILAMIQQRALEQAELMIFQDIEQAAEYADVDVETIKEWIGNGMPLIGDGFFTAPMLDLFRRENGKPDPEEVKEQQELDKQVFDSFLSPTGQIIPAGGLAGPKSPDAGTESGPPKDQPAPEVPKDKSPEQPQQKKRARVYILCGREYTEDELWAMPFSDLIKLLTGCT
jgi:prepilin-type N-terminal cleavage/methylation domain-containing protein